MGWLQCRLSFVCLWFNTSIIPPRLRYVVWDHRTATRHFEFRAGGPWWWEWNWKLVQEQDGVDAISKRNEHVIAVLMLRNCFTCFITSFKTECTFFWQNNYGCSNWSFSGIKQPRFLSFMSIPLQCLLNSLFNLLCFNFFNIFFASHLSFSKSRRWRFCPS